MDFTLEDWEELDLDLDQRDLFWDLLLLNSTPRPSLISQPDVREELGWSKEAWKPPVLVRDRNALSII